LIELAISVGTFAFIFLAWFIVTKRELILPVLLPSPARVWRGFLDVLANGYKDYSLAEHLLYSFRRLFLAYFLAAAAAVTLGLASGYNRYVRAVFDPVVEFYQSIPPLAYYTVIIIWLGIWEESKIAVLFLVAFAPIFIASMSGVKSVKRDYVNGAFMLGAGRLQVFLNVILPASLPYVFTGLRTSMAMAYGTLVAAEMVASVSGIAWLTFDAGRYNRTDIVFVGILIMGITSLILDRCIRFAENRIVPWKGKE
jgi:taurine transport system permease protein